MKELEKILTDLPKNYPAAQISDYIKLIYQNEFGCEHFMAEAAASLPVFKEELHTARRGKQLFEFIGNEFCRVYLKNAVELGAAPETLHRMVLYTAQQRHGSAVHFEAKLETFVQLCREKRLPFSLGAVQLYLLNYCAAGFPSTHHSNIYKETYAPSYRVISYDCARFFELFLRIDRMARVKKSPIIVAIDGPCASGKTTLSNMLQSCYPCHVFHTDDFYLRPEQRTAERLAEPGGNMDRERLEREVLTPITQQQAVAYRKYSCKTNTISKPERLPFLALNIVEGSYALHPELRRFYDIKVVLQLSPAQQLTRLKRRESRKSMELFRERWIPLEHKYIEETGLFATADLLYSVDESSE